MTNFTGSKAFRPTTFIPPCNCKIWYLRKPTQKAILNLASAPECYTSEFIGQFCLDSLLRLKVNPTPRHYHLLQAQLGI